MRKTLVISRHIPRRERRMNIISCCRPVMKYITSCVHDRAFLKLFVRLCVIFHSIKLRSTSQQRKKRSNWMANEALTESRIETKKILESKSKTYPSKFPGCDACNFLMWITAYSGNLHKQFIGDVSFWLPALHISRLKEKLIWFVYFHVFFHANRLSMPGYHCNRTQYS